jgi:hypothetical protein
LSTRALKFEVGGIGVGADAAVRAWWANAAAVTAVALAAASVQRERSRVFHAVPPSFGHTTVV